MKDTLIILGTAHLDSTPGKRSPDGKFREAYWSREFSNGLKPILEYYGLKVMIDWPELDMKPGTTQSMELAERVKIVNAEYDKGTQDVYYISNHVNAAGMGSQWMSARGWSVFTSPGKTTSDLLAEFLYISASKNLRSYKGWGTWESKQKPIRTDPSDGDSDYESNLYVLRKTKCPAVLVENMFQDNKDDVAYLTSEIGMRELQKTYVEGIFWFLENKK